MNFDKKFTFGELYGAQSSIAIVTILHNARYSILPNCYIKFVYQLHIAQNLTKFIKKIAFLKLPQIQMDKAHFQSTVLLLIEVHDLFLV